MSASSGVDGSTQGCWVELLNCDCESLLLGLREDCISVDHSRIDHQRLGVTLNAMEFVAAADVVVAFKGREDGFC